MQETDARFACVLTRCRRKSIRSAHFLRSASSSSSSSSSSTLQQQLLLPPHPVRIPVSVLRGASVCECRRFFILPLSLYVCAVRLTSESSDVAFVGRVDARDAAAVRFDWSGVEVWCAFHGDGASVTLSEQPGE